MTFTNFLQVLAFNLLSQIIPLCLFFGITVYFCVRYFEKRIGLLLTSYIAQLDEYDNEKSK